jgi:hypothetical protein
MDYKGNWGGEQVEPALGVVAPQLLGFLDMLKIIVDDDLRKFSTKQMKGASQ